MHWTQLSHSSNRRSVSWARDWLEKRCVLNENEGQLPFLDVLLSRGSDGSVSMSVYRKLSHTDKYLDFDSHHPLSHKRSVANTLHGRARTHCSSSQSRAHEMDCVKSALLQNGYPASILHSHKTRVPQLSAEKPEWKATTVMPYVRGVSESLRRILTPLGIRTCFKPHKIIRQILCKPKDPIPDLQQSGIVYMIPCSKCPASYVYWPDRSET